MRHRLLSRAKLIAIWQALVEAQRFHPCPAHRRGPWYSCAYCESVQSLMDVLQDAMARMRALGGGV